MKKNRLIAGALVLALLAGCSGGGGRFDAGMLRPQIFAGTPNCLPSTAQPFRRKSIFFYWYMPFRLPNNTVKLPMTRPGMRSWAMVRP